MPDSFGEPPDLLAGIANPPPRARLSVGVISAGRVGTALGAALERVGHVVTAVSAPSTVSRDRAARQFPEAKIASVPQVARAAELLIVAVPDAVLATVVGQVAELINPSAIVLHTSGANGVGVLDPLTRQGCTAVAFHPAMTFVDSPDDVARLANCCIGITAVDEVGLAVGQALALEIGAEPVRVPEESRLLYHAALAHGANHLVALIDDAVAVLSAALASEADPNADHNAGYNADHDSVGGPSAGLAQRVLAPLARAALDNALRAGPAALTGPAARGDAALVADHLTALDRFDPGIGAAYRAQSRRAAAQSGTATAIDPVLDHIPQEYS